MKRYLIILLLIIIFPACINNHMESSESNSPSFDHIRKSAVAGQFYPADAVELKRIIEKYLESARLGIEPPARLASESIAGRALNPRAIIVPHAGYDYSGPVAAVAYSTINKREIGTVVLICNSHTDYFPGLAIDESEAWETPLGKILVDHDLAARLVESSDLIKYNSEVHTSDHTLEVQLPFLQTVLKDGFKIVGIVFGNTGDTAYTALAQALADNLGDNDLLVISTDLSHYPSYDDAKRIDKQTLGLIKKGNIEALDKHIKTTLNQNIQGEQTLCCGIDGVKTLLELVKKLNWEQTEILEYKNSGDASIGDKSRVVGYGAMAFGQRAVNKEQRTKNSLSNRQKDVLLELARETVEAHVKGKKLPDYDIKDERLNWQEGAFVTLKMRGELRGCIGQIIPSSKPLWQVVRNMAVSASTEDPRFPPVSKSELASLEYEVSVLSAPEKIDDWQKIEMGKHGVIVRQGFQSGVFLPQVATETGWDRETFLSELCAQKAGLHPECYKDKTVEIQIFTAQVFG